jgi:cation:H+ antiporter
MLEAVVQLVVGLIVLAAGAEALARGVARLCGFAIPGLGSTAAGLATCVTAVLTGHRELALGTVIGRSVAAVGLVGVAAVVRPLALRSGVVRGGIGLMVGPSLLFWFLCGDNTLNRDDGALLLCGFLVLLVVSVRMRRSLSAGKETNRMPPWLAAVLVVAGAGGLVGGAYLTATGAAGLDEGKGLRVWLLGLTAVAAGSSVPGAIEGVRAVRRGDPDGAFVGAAAGAVLNVLLVLGVTVVVNPVRVSNAVLTRELPVAALFGLLLLPALFNGYRVHRWEGAVLLAACAAFVVWGVSRFR